MNKMFKLISGEMVIALVDGETDLTLSVQNPLGVHFAPSPDGRLGINLFPLNPFASTKEDKITFKKEHIMFEVDVVDEKIEKEYIRITSGIEIAKNMPKIEVPN